jgi:hypothetical protein
MAYLESFFLYLGLVVLGATALLLVLVVLLGIIKLMLLIFKKEASFLSPAVFKKGLKFYSIGYSVFASLFYIAEAKIYVFGDRAYKEAKMYAIAGEYVFWHKAFLLVFVYPNHAVLKPLDTVESYILKKMYVYIPQTDGERQIWNYKFRLVDYAKTMYAPLVEEDRKKGLSFTNPGGSMEPELLDTLDEIYTAMDTLNQTSMADKQFDKIDRYLIIASMAPYYIEYIPYRGDLHSEWKKNTYFIDKLDKVYNNPKNRNEFVKYLHILDKTHDAMQEDKELAQAFEEHPSVKGSFYWGATLGYSALDSMQERNNNVYPCTSETFLQFVKYYKEYVHWAYMTPNSTFHSLSKRQKSNYDFKIEAQNNAYYIAKYICKIPFEYITSEEKSINSFKNFESLYRDRPNIKHIRKLEKQINQGEEDGNR